MRVHAAASGSLRPIPRRRTPPVRKRAGLYELWRDNDLPADYPDAWLAAFTIIMTTTAATDDIGHVHDRMPMIVVCENWADWLDPRLIDNDDIRALMATPPVGSLDIYAVTKAVNNVCNNGPELLEPLPAE
jgi:putative SOS response-associated peptidase YedK